MNITVSALYLTAAPFTPKEATEVLGLISKVEQFTVNLNLSFKIANTVQWNEFPSPTPLLGALGAGKIDLEPTADAGVLDVCFIRQVDRRDR